MMQWFSIMKENDLGTSLMLNMLKCSFLFVNCIYLIDFTVFKLINYQLLKIRFISIWITWIHRNKRANVCRVNRSEHRLPPSPKVGNACAKDGTKTSGLEGAYLRTEISLVGRKTNILVRIPNVVSSLLTIYLCWRQSHLI